MARTHSLEQRLMRYAALVMFIVLMLCILLVITWGLDWFASISIMLPVIAVSLFAVVKSYMLTLDVIERFG
ncbi:sensor histidine kinase, partial [Pseudoalteromonas sp.]|nr:sensor histidine kinase [Pseudoalteromonas sp.]